MFLSQRILTTRQQSVPDDKDQCPNKGDRGHGVGRDGCPNPTPEKPSAGELPRKKEDPLPEEGKEPEPTAQPD
jgi:hypothetical protein